MPWKRSSSTGAASRSSFSTSAPPSMVVMFLLGWKLNETMSPWRRRAARPSARADRQRRVLDHAHPVRAARRRRAASRSTGRGEVDGEHARGCAGVIAAAPASRSMLRVRRSTSTKTGVAPVRTITLAVATKVMGGRDDLVAGPDAASPGRPPCAAVAEVSVRTGRPPKQLGERLLEGGTLRAAGDPAASAGRRRPPRSSPRRW